MVRFLGHGAARRGGGIDSCRGNHCFLGEWVGWGGEVDVCVSVRMLVYR